MLKKTIISLSIGAFLGLSAIPSFAAPIKLANSASGCTRYSGFSFSPQGAVTLKGCSKASRQATFTITPAATTVEKGSPLKITILRTIGSEGKAGKDVLTLKSTGVAGTFSPATVTFNTGTTRKTVTVKFSAGGSAVLSATGGTGAALTPSAAIAVSSTKSCAGITPFVLKNNRPAPEQVRIGSYGFGPVDLQRRGSSDTYVSAALSFQVSAAIPVSGYWAGQYTDYTGAAVGPVYAAISECSGDMRGAGTGSGSVEDRLCRKDPADTFLGVVFSNAPNTHYCKLIPGKTYYYNIQAEKADQNPGMLVNFNAQ